MNQAEKIVREHLEEEGWTVYRNGWPDFAAVKDDQVRFIEVKRNYQLSDEQRTMHLFLRSLGFYVEVVQVYFPKGEGAGEPVAFINNSPPKNQKPSLRDDPEIANSVDIICRELDKILSH